MGTTAKVRRVDLWPDDWLGGTAELNDTECGIYFRACALIYSRGGPITRSHLRQVCKSRAPLFARILERLIALGKLIPVDGERLDQARCELELNRAQRRVEAAQENGRSRWNGEKHEQEPVSAKINGIADAPASARREAQSDADLAPPRHDGDTTATLTRHETDSNSTLTRVEQEPVSAKINGLQMPTLAAPALLAKRKQEKSLRLDSKGALGCAWAREATPAPNEADKEAVGKICTEIYDILGLPPSGLRSGTIRAPSAYREAITASKREKWLNNLAAFVGEALGSLGEQMAAWEAIEAARAAGSREATPPEARQAVDRLSRLREMHAEHREAAN